MFRAGIQAPQLLLWQARLSRIPRWGWAVIGIAVAVPLAVLFLTVAVIALTAGAMMLAVVLGILAVRGLARRLTGRPGTRMARRDPFTAHDVIVVERVDKPTDYSGGAQQSPS